MVGESLLGFGKSFRIDDVCPRWWWGSELDGDQEVEAWWGPESKDVIDPGHWGDGSSVGAYFGWM